MAEEIDHRYRMEKARGGDDTRFENMPPPTEPPRAHPPL
jgi:hypothetical protein